MTQYLPTSLFALTCMAFASAAYGQTAPFEISRFTFEGAQVLDERRLQAIVAPYLGPQRSMDDVSKAAAAVKLAYA